MYTVNAIRNICLVGHSGSGKSALAESLLYMTGAIDRMGKNADGNTVIEAEIPMAEMSSYAIDLRAMTQARGSFTLTFERYEEVPKANQAKIIEDAKKNED